MNKPKEIKYKEITVKVAEPLAKYCLISVKDCIHPLFKGEATTLTINGNLIETTFLHSYKIDAEMIPKIKEVSDYLESIGYGFIKIE